MTLTQDCRPRQAQGGEWGPCKGQLHGAVFSPTCAVAPVVGCSLACEKMRESPASLCTVSFAAALGGHQAEARSRHFILHYLRGLVPLRGLHI